jgi:hypothetical protein
LVILFCTNLLTLSLIREKPPEPALGSIRVNPHKRTFKALAVAVYAPCDNIRFRGSVLCDEPLPYFLQKGSITHIYSETSAVRTQHQLARPHTVTGKLVAHCLVSCLKEVLYSRRIQQVSYWVKLWTDKFAGD